jgi:mannose-1-phosphate guanylyltransferase
MFVVTQAHESCYREELRNVDDSRTIPQPLNRGTGVAVAMALLHIMHRDPDAVVVLVPCGRYYSDGQAFGRAV